MPVGRLRSFSVNRIVAVLGRGVVPADTPLLRADPPALPPESSRFGRWARPEEISAAVVFLASDESSYISGSDLVIDATHTAE